MKQSLFNIKTNTNIADGVYKMCLSGDTSAITVPGQFVNIKIDGLFLRRPISVCDWDADTLTLVYKVVGKGTELMSKMKVGKLDLLSGLGNGYDISKSKDNPLLIGGGVGVPPLYNLCKKLKQEGKKVSVILGFNTKADVFFETEFKNTGANVYISTADGSYGAHGYVTDIMEDKEYSFFYACGPEAMFKAISRIAKSSGEYSFEERMGCGFGACMGCSCKTLTGNKRICKDGPVMESGEIIWKD